MPGRSRHSNQDKSFPGWGAVVLPGGLALGVLLGWGLGMYFGIPGIGVAIGSAVGISVGIALLAAAVVIASTRSGK